MKRAIGAIFAVFSSFPSFDLLQLQAEFIGKEIIVRERKEDFQWKKLVMLEMEMAESPAWPEGNLTVWSAGRAIGNVTSGCYSPATGKGLGFAYIPTVLSTPGCDDIRVELFGQKLKAKVLPGPPVLTQPMREKEAAKKAAKKAAKMQ